MRIRATDLNDIGLSDGGSDDEEGKGVPPLVLPRDPKVLITKIRRLQDRKTERLKKEGKSITFTCFRFGADQSVFDCDSSQGW